MNRVDADGTMGYVLLIGKDWPDPGRPPKKAPLAELVHCDNCHLIVHQAITRQGKTIRLEATERKAGKFILQDDKETAPLRRAVWWPHGGDWKYHECQKEAA